MPRRPGKTVVIGLELGDGQLVRAWAQAGRLPCLKALMDQGCWGWLETTAEQLHISAWPCIYTGATPGEHGVYFTFQPAPGLQGYQRFHTGLYGRPTFWKVLDSAGRTLRGVRCAVLAPGRGLWRGIRLRLGHLGALSQARVVTAGVAQAAREGVRVVPFGQRGERPWLCAARSRRHGAATREFRARPRRMPRAG